MDWRRGCERFFVDFGTVRIELSSLSAVWIVSLSLAVSWLFWNGNCSASGGGDGACDGVTWDDDVVVGLWVCGGEGGVGSEYLEEAVSSSRS